MIQVIPVVVRKEKVIYWRNIFSMVYVRSFKASGAKRYRRGVAAKNGIHQYLLTIDLKIVRGMSKPDQDIFVYIQVFKICFYWRNLIFGRGSFIFFEQEFFQYRKIIGTFCKRGVGFKFWNCPFLKFGEFSILLFLSPEGALPNFD